MLQIFEVEREGIDADEGHDFAQRDDERGRDDDACHWRYLAQLCEEVVCAWHGGVRERDGRGVGASRRSAYVACPMSSTTFAPASIALELAPCPALMDLLASEFERVYALHGPYFDDRSVCESRTVHMADRLISHTARHIHSLNAMESLRQACLDYVATIHSQLRFRLSGNVRINQLPQDVLIHVFSVMSLDDVVRATHVCHAWRKLGLETATLWTNVVLVGPAVASATEILDRSKAAPVDIHLSQLSPAQWRVSITSLNCHMYKVRSLTIRPRMYEPTRNGRPPRTDLTDAWILPAVPGLRVLDII